MRDPENVLNSLQEYSAQSGYVYDRLYRNLFNREFFLRAYQNIYASQGNMTAGTDGKTIDAMSLERIDRLIATLKDESYQPKPSRRTYIPKKNGKLRPLGIPSIDDKLVQEVVRMLLESIYENSFEDASHGFRPDRSCHTALRMIQNRFTRCKWFVEGDIKGFFDNIDHNVMIGILRKRIKDERFLRLIRKFLNAGYMEDNQLHQSYSGTPQGGIISPILANIYLDQFDKYMAEYKKRFDRGNKRAVNVEYHKLSAKRIRLKRKLAKAQSEEEKQSLLESIRELDKVHKSIPCKNPIVPPQLPPWRGTRFGQVGLGPNRQPKIPGSRAGGQQDLHAECPDGTGRTKAPPQSQHGRCRRQRRRQDEVLRQTESVSGQHELYRARPERRTVAQHGTPATAKGL